MAKNGGLNRKERKNIWIFAFPKLLLEPEKHELSARRVGRNILTIDYKWRTWNGIPVGPVRRALEGITDGICGPSQNGICATESEREPGRRAINHNGTDSSNGSFCGSCISHGNDWPEGRGREAIRIGDGKHRIICPGISIGM